MFLKPEASLSLIDSQHLLANTANWYIQALFKAYSSMHNMEKYYLLLYSVRLNLETTDISVRNPFSIIAGIQLQAIHRPESQDIPATYETQQRDVDMETELQDTSISTSRPTSILSADTDSSQRYESMDGSDEIYTFVTAPTTPAERPGQEHQNPLPLLTDVSSRLRSIQASHSPPQPVYSYCDVQTSNTKHKSTAKPSQSRPRDGRIADRSRHTATISQQTLHNQKCNEQKTVCSSGGNTIFVTIPSHGIALKISSRKK